MKPLFTPEELEEMRRADEEIEEGFFVTNEELAASRERDRRHKFNELDARGQKVAETQRRYREANREKVAETKRQALKAFRREHGLTQQQVGDAIGVCKATVCRWEKGELPLDVERIKAGFPLFEYKEEERNVHEEGKICGMGDHADGGGAAGVHFPG